MLRGFLITCALAGAAKAGPQALYVDLFGKGGLYGVGYDVSVMPYLAFGAAGSYYALSGDRYLTLAPYVAVYPYPCGRHRWFMQGGPELQRRDTPSTVPEWKGMAMTSFSAELSTGYEYRGQLLFRAYAMIDVGAHAAPGLGLTIGWTF
jgi:hypothetical protein